MTFDPFGDFETAGYLRNVAGEKDPDIVEGMEQVSVETGLDEAFRHLQSMKPIQYKHVLEVHRILFNAVYPWAGQDRATTTPEKSITRGTAEFARPSDIKLAVDHALQLGNDPERMAAQPGKVMGLLAFGHPFLDGNGRTIMLTHSVLGERAGISIDWASTDKHDYLTALAAEIDDPRVGHLDSYLARFIAKPVGMDDLVTQLKGVKGLNDKSEGDKATSLDDPDMRERYRQTALKYKEIFNDETSVDGKE